MLKVVSRAATSVAPRVKTASTRFGPAFSIVTDCSRIEQRQPLDDNRFVFSTTVRWSSSSSSSSGGKKREPAIRMDTHMQHSVHDGTLRAKMRMREPVVGVMTSFHNDTDHVEMIGLMGYDFIWANATSSSSAAANPDSIKSIILAAERRGMPTLVQMGQGYQNIVGHANTYLAAGAQGIILQQCESKDDVMKLVDAVKFPPLGKRALGKERWNGWCLTDTSNDNDSLSDAIQASNDNTIIAVVIETQKGIDALDEILTVKELDFVFVSPTNLSVAKIDDAGEKIRKAGKSSGTLTMNNNTKEDYTTWRNLGFNVMCTSAQSMFFDGARHMMDVIVEHEGIKDLKAIRSSKIEYKDASDSSSSDSEDDESKESEATQPPPKPAMPVPDLSDAECLKSATMKVIASKMDSHEVASLQEMFDLIDTNGDGDLQLEEIEDVIEDGGFNRHLTAKLESIRDNMIENNQDVLYWKKYLLESLDEDVYLNDDNIQKAYDHLKESCGTMNVEGLTKAFGDEELTRKVLNVVDTNHDGEIQFEEFRDAVNKLMASADGDDDDNNNSSETKRKLGEW